MIFSPPFLWPGQRITYYTLLVRDTGNDVVLEDRINATFGDTVVTFTHVLDHSQRQSCSKLVFVVSALSESDELFKPFNVTLEYPAGKSVCALH